MFTICFNKEISKKINADEHLFVNVRGTIAYSCLSRMHLRSSSSNKNLKEVIYKKPHFEVSLSDAQVVRNSRCSSAAYNAVADYLDKVIAEKSKKNLPFYALDFNTYSADAAVGTLPLREDGTLRAELAQGVDVTLKLCLALNPENGILGYTFYGITVNEPARFYNYYLKRPVFFDEQAA